jgi:hypothetical protein
MPYRDWLVRTYRPISQREFVQIDQEAQQSLRVCWNRSLPACDAGRRRVASEVLLDRNIRSILRVSARAFGSLVEIWGASNREALEPVHEQARVLPLRLRSCLYETAYEPLRCAREGGSGDNGIRPSPTATPGSALQDPVLKAGKFTTKDQDRDLLVAFWSRGHTRSRGCHPGKQGEFTVSHFEAISVLSLF